MNKKIQYTGNLKKVEHPFHDGRSVIFFLKPDVKALPPEFDPETADQSDWVLLPCVVQNVKIKGRYSSGFTLNFNQEETERFTEILQEVSRGLNTFKNSEFKTIKPNEVES